MRRDRVNVETYRRYRQDQEDMWHIERYGETKAQAKQRFETEKHYKKLIKQASTIKFKGDPTPPNKPTNPVGGMFEKLRRHSGLYKSVLYSIES